MPDQPHPQTPAGQTAGAGSASTASERPASGRAVTGTACLVLADGSVFHGQGFGATGESAGMLGFNTAMSGYQELMTDPASAGQIICFTFPHIGVAGINPEDDQSPAPTVAGIVTRELPTRASNWRARGDLAGWMADHGIIGIAGIDTRRLTLTIRRCGTAGAVLAHDPQGRFDIAALQARAVGAMPEPRLAGPRPDRWDQGPWHWPGGFAAAQPAGDAPLRVTVLDHGAGFDALRQLAATGAEVAILPGSADLATVRAQHPDGIFLSHGPGDPRAIGDPALAVIRGLIGLDLPIYAIGFGHQVLALALGAEVRPLPHGHRGANHPVQADADNRIEIAAMNHRFAVEGASLPSGVRASHHSLFYDCNCGLVVEGRAVFSTQHQPGSDPDRPGVIDPFARFAAAMRARKAS